LSHACGRYSLRVRLPTFVVIGAVKAGTGSLYHWLRQHPDVFMPPTLKETSYFCYDADNPDHRKYAGTKVFPVTTLDEYGALFADAGPAKAVGEASPRYLNAPRVPRAMKEVLPDARLVVSLREPVSRLFSNAQMDVRVGKNSDVVAAARRLADTDQNEYAPKLASWLEEYPRERLLALRFEDLAAAPVETAQRVYRFLEVDDTFRPDTAAVHNPGGLPRSALWQRAIEFAPLRRLKPVAPMAVYNALARLRRMNSRPADPLPSELHAELLERFRADILATQALLDLDLSSWLDV
jgi:hypothetical protein